MRESQVAADFVFHDGRIWERGPINEAHISRCYEVSALRVAEGPDGHWVPQGHEGAHVAHGVIRGPGCPPLYHGWVIEPDGQVWEPTTDTVYPAPVFEALFAPIEFVRYSVREARRHMVITGHYGVWEDVAIQAVA